MVAILVVCTIILFIAADLLVQWLRARRTSPAAASTPAPTRATDLLLPALQLERFSLPGGLFFHRGHTWVNVLFSGQVKVGVDDFFQRLIGRVDAITLPPVGVEVKEGQPFAAVRQGGRTALLAAPVDGVVCAVNSELAKVPGLLKRDPYTRGWLVAVRPTNLATNLPGLTIGDGAMSWLKGELAKLQEFLYVSLTIHQDALVGATAADGGLMADGLVEHLDEATWKEFQSKFLGA
ncbi:MAG TPA: glycine cleavage system protein H [Candidatus Methylomirabilis sp.]|nr:glycine cleavage system protein H [Candidatus Methylomirabilis sp.]HSB77823.1 glycine cleavage system protein H [Candidatus Methylomirabilis sp.]HSC70377.1 glycine cleavage system protein H [Candidatus Methylomirabilis sp.]